MDKLVIFTVLLLKIAAAAHLPEVHEEDDRSNPSTFNFEEYQKTNRVDLQKLRYQQQQLADSKNIVKRHNRQLDLDQQSAESESHFIQNKESKIVKKSLKPNSYMVNEDDDDRDKVVESRRDLSSKDYLYLSPNKQQSLKGLIAPQLFQPHERQLKALNSLLGQTPTVQLEGLQQLITNNNLFARDHKPINEDVMDIPNTQTKPNIKVPHMPVTIDQSLLQDNNNKDISVIQAQLDAAANSHAHNILAQAQQKAIDHVKAQHAAILKAQERAELNALAQVRAQNEAIALAQAQAQAEAQAEAEAQEAAKQKSLEETRKTEERKRQQQLARARVQAQRAKQEKLEASLKLIKPKKPKQQTEPAETQHYYYTQAPQLLAQQVSEDNHHHHHHHQLLHPVHDTSRYVYGQGQPDVAEVTKFYVPPQISVQEGKNEHGEHELQYAAKYEFGYRIKDHEHGSDFGHRESKDGEHTKGYYHVLLPDGRVQNVHYYVDPTGYHADVSYADSAEHGGA